MHFMRSSGILAIVAVLNLAALQRTALADSKQQFKEVAGRAVDADGSPVVGAVVRCWLEDEYQGTGWYAEPRPLELTFDSGAPPKTNAEGRFQVRLALPEKGRVWLQLEAEGFVPAATEWLAADHVSSAAIGTLWLRRLREIGGRVVDDAGHPLAEAEVFQVGDTHERTSAKTDADGKFLLPGVADGRTIVFARKPGYRFQGRLVSADDKSVEVVLTRNDQRLPALRTRPFPISREEELRLCHEVADDYRQTILSTGDEAQLYQLNYWYGWCDPWAVIEQGKGYSVYWLARSLYADDPEQALAEVEADKDPQLRILTLLKLWPDVPAGQREQRHAILDRAWQHALAIAIPEARSDAISWLAKRLADCGEVERAKALVEELRPLVADFADEDSRGRFADALATFDPDAAIDMMMQLKDKRIRSRYQFRVAYQLAAIRPEKSELLLERIANASAERGYPSNFDDIKAAAVCFRMANADLPRANRIADRMGNIFFRAYAYGMVGLALAPSDKVRGEQFLDQAFDLLDRGAQSDEELKKLDRAWLSAPPSYAALALLPVVEEVVPSRLQEFLWRSVALRLPHTVGRDSHRIDAAAAMLLARYDRELATVMLDRLVSRFPELIRDGHSYRLELLPRALALADPSRGARVIKSAMQAVGTEFSDERGYVLQGYVTLLARPRHMRWPLATVSLELWRPEEEVLDDLGLVW